MTAPTTQQRDVLTQADAEARAARVSNTAYEIALDLKPKAETYRGSFRFIQAHQRAELIHNRGQ